MSAPRGFAIAPQHRAYLLLTLTPVVIFTGISVYTQSYAYNVFLTAAPGSVLEENGKARGLEPVPTVFARKSNPINVYFIKYAWLWTTIAWLAQLWTLRRASAVADIKGKGKARDEDEDETDTSSPSGIPTSPVARSIVRYLVATLCWISFALWLFGPSLMERILTLSGGVCIPHHEHGFSNLSGDASPIDSLTASGFQLPELRIDGAFCRAGRRGISRDERPDLFRTAHLIVADAVGSDRLKGKWKGGHDVSGHIFILILSSLFLLEELSPYLPHFFMTYLPPSLNVYASTSQAAVQLRARNNPYSLRDPLRTRNAGVTIGILALVTLWIFSIVNTSLFFHTPGEKITGALLAVACWALLPKGR